MLTSTNKNKYPSCVAPPKKNPQAIKVLKKYVTTEANLAIKPTSNRANDVTQKSGLKGKSNFSPKRMRATII